MISEKGSAEPSMDEILASIRQIISEPSKKTEPKRSQPKVNEDILDLTHLLPDEVNSSAPSKKQEKTISKPIKKSLSHPVDSELREGSVTLDQDDLLRILKDQRQGFETDLQSERSLPGGQTIEELARESLTPLIKEWLDINLPSIVREIVGEKVERIVRQFSK